MAAVIARVSGQEVAGLPKPTPSPLGFWVCADPRPHSAPAAAEASLLGAASILDPRSALDDDLDVFNCLDQGSDIYRRDPEYHTYYHTHRALNPRLPPPLSHFHRSAIPLEEAGDAVVVEDSRQAR